jgi:hypothetical protein
MARARGVASKPAHLDIHDMNAALHPGQLNARLRLLVLARQSGVQSKGCVTRQSVISAGSALAAATFLRKKGQIHSKPLI